MRSRMAPAAQWAELGIFTAHRAFTSDRTQRGNNCFLGLNNEVAAPGYLEFNEDEESRLPISRFAGPLTGTSGRLRHVRTPARVQCTAYRTGLSEITGQYVVEDLAAETGKIALNADKLQARLAYLWISYQ